MMKIKTVIIDDEPIALEKLKKYVLRMPVLELVGSFGNSVDAMKYIYDIEVHLIITDINMPDLNGIDLVKSCNKKPMVIFTTAYPEYAIDGYKVSAVDYLLKPYGFSEFGQAVNKVAEIIEKTNLQTTMKDSVSEDFLFVKVDHRFIRVDLSEIVYIKGYGEYLQIFIANQSNPILTLSSFAAIMERLDDNFLQVHRSYVVNMSKITLVDKNRIKMTENIEIPIGDVYKNDLHSYLMIHSIGKNTK